MKSVVSYLLSKSQVHTPHWDVPSCHKLQELSLVILLTILTSCPHLTCIYNVSNIISPAKRQVHTPHWVVSTCQIYHEVSLEMLLTSLPLSSYLDNISNFIYPAQESGSHTSLSWPHSSYVDYFSNNFTSPCQNLGSHTSPSCFYISIVL